MTRGTLIIIFFVCLGCTHSHNLNINSGNIKDINSFKNPVKLNIIGHWLNEGKREKLMRELVTEFEFLHQEYSVNLVFPEKVYWDRNDQYCEQKFVQKCVMAESSDWDVIRINNAYKTIADYMKDPDWAKKYLVDFSEIDEFRKNSLPELVSDSAKESWKGTIPGPSLEGFNWLIWYNRQLASEIGINVKQFGMTFDDLLSYVKAIDGYNKKNNKNIIPIHVCSDWTTRNLITQFLFLSALNNTHVIYEDNYNDNKLNAFEQSIKAIELLEQNNAFPKNFNNIKWDKSVDYPLRKKSFFYLNASWMYNIWQKIDSAEVNNMVPAELPVFKPTNLYFGGYFITWAVPKNAVHRDAAVKFLLFMTRPDIAEKWSRYTKCPTGIKGNITSVALGLDPFENFTFGIQKKYELRKIPFVDDAAIFFGESKSTVNTHINEISDGTMTANEALADVYKQLGIRKR